MFGYTSSAAAVRNVFLVGDGSNTVAYVNAQGGNSASGSASRVSIGVLVGYNRGTVSNCSVSGSTMEYSGYSASTASLGGFVGSNYAPSATALRTARPFALQIRTLTPMRAALRA